MNYYTKITKTGQITISEDNGYIVSLALPSVNKNFAGEFYQSSVLEKAFLELEEYFLGERTEFNLPLKLVGTQFQLKVWRELQKVPYGETRTYGEIAELIGNPKASRAVGCANNKNPIPIIVPCHRIISSDGSLSGYAGGTALKLSLLNLEKGISL